MKFAQPIWLVILLILLPSLVWVLHYFHRVRLHTLKSFASEHLMETLTANISYFQRDIKKCLLLAGISLCLFALARPQFGFRWEEVQRKGIDILFAVDTSRSMLAEDVNPNRLARAKMAVLDLVSKLKGDRIGMIAFAGTSFLQCPLTLDYDAFHQSLEALDTSVIPQGGTDIASAIKEAEQAFSLGHPSHKILILITDGEDLEANGIAASKNAADHRMKIFTVGVGTSTGELIPVRNSSGGVEFLKDDKGQVVKSRLDESTLKKIAEVTGGFYEPLGQQGQGLERVYDQGLASIPKQELSSKMNKVYMDRFQWPLALAIFCLTIEMLLSDRKRCSKFHFRKRAKAVVSIILLSTILYPLLLSASPQAAERAYRQGKFLEAVREYKAASEKNPKNPELQFNFGTASYKNRNLDDAITSFQKALQTDNPSLQQQVFYNLGNTHYRLGEKTEKENPQKTIEVWQQALQDYQNALKLHRNDADAQFNYEFVKKKLEELKQKQPPENKKDKDPNEKNSQEQSSSNSQNKEKKQPDRENKTAEKQPPENQSTQKENNQNKAQNNQQAQQPQNQKSAGQEKEQQEKEQELPRLAGQMNKEEARALLDSLKDDEKKMPVVFSKPEGEDKVKRDW